ncbi:ATP-dependent DNA helicase [Salipaludibacillus keqinensis]|uniref:ATP-dependent DNA helicase n=1 Tax=Salipaludibacillus keqinensis TaxID=2045207 RepID=A0A323TKJ0_9BACI|nr:ATP-dependent DNA helicase RecQ [Salipaludibacillus keqinensis]PYZ94474.1 ATP-dependent DNA helicase [Salipaludibacillus keqinensis]
MTNSLLQSLEQQFGFHAFREGQEEIIQSVIQGTDVIAILPTGRGKTLCYHLPAKLLDGLTIVVSPLVSLMEDQVTQMRASGDKRVAHLSSLINDTEKKKVLANLHSYHLIFLSPEMLSLPFIQRTLSKVKVDLFVVDEAHCISQWGHEFRTDYLRLKGVRKQLGNPPCLALTATATKEVEKDICVHLGLKKEVVVRFPVNRENIFMAVESMESIREKEEYFINKIHSVQWPAIVYTGTRQRAMNYAALLSRSGIEKVAFYHGGMTKEDRILVQQQFIRDEIDIICCTNAFGMGINKSNIRSVIHLHLPSTIEQYVQEIGRAGRDGKQSLALLIYCDEDLFLPLSFIETEFPDDDFLKQLMTDESIDGKKVADLKQHFPLNETQWRMVTFYLEKENVVQNGEFQFGTRRKEVLNEMISNFDQRRKEKIYQLDCLKRFVQTDTCYRKNVTVYFNDAMAERPEWCCSSCQSTGQYITWAEKNIDSIHRSLKNKEEKYDWKDTLKKILISKNGDV